jgi:hypothetical protein
VPRPLHLSGEEKELLREAAGGEFVAPLLKALLAFVEMQDADVLKCTSDEANRLVLQKAKAEGARKLYTDFERHLTSLKGK